MFFVQFLRVLELGLFSNHAFNKPNKVPRRQAKVKAGENIWKAEKEKDKVRRMQSRAAAKMSEEEWKIYRENACIKQHRDQKKLQIDTRKNVNVNDNETVSPYWTVQAIGKPMIKVRTSLLKSTRKKVAQALANEIGIDVGKKKKKALQLGLDEDTKNVIVIPT